MRPLVGASITLHTRGDNKNAPSAGRAALRTRRRLARREATPHLAFGLGLCADETLDEGRDREFPLSLTRMTDSDDLARSPRRGRRDLLGEER